MVPALWIFFDQQRPAAALRDIPQTMYVNLRSCDQAVVRLTFRASVVLARESFIEIWQRNLDSWQPRGYNPYQQLLDDVHQGEGRQASLPQRRSYAIPVGVLHFTFCKTFPFVSFCREAVIAFSF